MSTDEMTTETQMREGMLTVGRAVTVALTVKDDTLTSWFDSYIMSAGLTFSQHASWDTDSQFSNVPVDALLVVRAVPGTHRAIITVRGMLAIVVVERWGNVRATVYSKTYSEGDMEAVLDQLRAWLPIREAPTPDVVHMTFRYHSTNGDGSRTREIEAPSWTDIRGNYTAAVQEHIDRMVTGFQPGAAGRLILFHGPPGTGKTYVIRMLAREWREWCNVEYIADPEIMFGSASYLMKALLDSDTDDEKWRLLVVEDAGELLSGDAKIRTGQGLSRLLNLGEGLIGQGLKVLTMVSTNDDLKSLNEAVARPGRAAVEVEFGRLTIEESNAWLAERGRQDLVVTSEMTLAELFALISGTRITTSPRREPIGFIKG